MIRLDETAFPVVHVGWDEIPTDEDLETYLRALTTLVERQAPFGVIHDVRGMRSVPSNIRQRAADYMSGFSDDELGRFVQVVVHNTIVMRGVITAIRWLVRNRVLIRDVTDIAAAAATVDEFLAHLERAP